MGASRLALQAYLTLGDAATGSRALVDATDRASTTTDSMAPEEIKAVRRGGAPQLTKRAACVKNLRRGSVNELMIEQNTNTNPQQNM